MSRAPLDGARRFRARYALTALALSATLAGTGLASADEIVAQCNAPIRVSDGATLYANIRRPASAGQVPTILTATGYNKDAGALAGTCATLGAGLVEHGYAVMMLDDRGTGASEGKWDSWGQRTQEDYADVLDWIQAQPWSDGSVGTTGGSYMGITSLLIAEKDAERVAAGKPRAVKAVWADVPMADAYRDVTYHGGNTDTGFIPLWLGLTHGLSVPPPSTTGSDPNAPATWADHTLDIAEFGGAKVLDSTLGGDSVYDSQFYRVRSPGERAGQIQVPVAWTGGWFDIFQRGEPLLFELLSAAPVKKFWMGANYHAAIPTDDWNAQNIGSADEVRLRWWDRWLKGNPNGVESLPSVNLWTMGSGEWIHAEQWPLAGTDYTPLYFGPGASGSATSLNDGTLTVTPPTTAGYDRAPVLEAGGVCDRGTTQWTAGLSAGTPCEEDNRVAEVPGLTYTTAPLEGDTTIAGLLTAEIYAELSRSEATFSVALSDVDSEGKSTQITAGWLNASHRLVDEVRSTRAPDGRIIRPWHPYTREAQQPVVSNEAERYLVEVYPTAHTFLTGHRIRVTITTGDAPHMATPTPALVNAAGGAVRVLRSARYPSNILLPLRTQ